MKVTFKELISSEAYQQNAQLYAKAMIFVSAIAVLVNYFIRDDAHIIGAIMLIFMWSLFGVSFFLALPFYIVYVWLITKMSSHVSFPFAELEDSKGKFWRSIASIWNRLTYIANVAITYFIADLFWS